MYGIPGYSDPYETVDLSVSEIDWKLSFKHAGMFLAMFVLGFLATIGILPFK